MTQRRTPLFDSCPDPQPAPERKSLFSDAPALSGVVEIKNRNSALFGDSKIRKRIEISLNDLQKYSQDQGVLQQSLKQILETNVDELCLTYVLNWGEDLQKRYTQQLQAILDLSTHIWISDAKTTINGLIEKLGELEPEDITKKSWFSSKEDRIDKMKTEMQGLQSKGMGIETRNLVSLHDAALDIKTVLNKISQQLEPYIITCQFFAEYVKDDFPNHLYISRLQSLLTTKLGIQSDVQTTELLMTTILNLVDGVNNVIRTEIPMWISNFSAVVVGSFDINQLKQSQDKILQKLKQTVK